MDAEHLLTGAITEKPTSFLVGSTRYHLYPPTLGALLLVRSLVAASSLQAEVLSLSPALECLRLAREERELCLRLVALSTFRKREEIQDEGRIRKRMQALGRGLESEELAALVGLVLRSDDYDIISEHYGLAAEQDERQRISHLKSDGSMLHFGGRTLYGGLLDFVCQRYGWTLDYCLWGISYLNLRLLSADASLSVYLSEDERKRYYAERNTIDADDPANSDAIRAFFDIMD